MRLLPLVVVFLAFCSSIVGSKITREDLTIVQEFGLQLSSYDITGRLVAEKFVDISRVRDFVINEVRLSPQLLAYFVYAELDNFDSLRLPGIYRREGAQPSRPIQGKCFRAKITDRWCTLRLRIANSERRTSFASTAPSNDSWSKTTYN